MLTHGDELSKLIKQGQTHTVVEGYRNKTEHDSTLIQLKMMKDNSK